jgi:ElaB/YqjD/DUF883 family membrane-anchored ribosome-binding protein
MEKDNYDDGNAEETAARSQASGKPSGFEKVKNHIADRLQDAANVLAEKAENQEAKSGMTEYGKQASEWLDQSAEYVRQFDHNQANARVREYVGQRPGRSLLIAGGVGLIIGAILRRR